MKIIKYKLTQGPKDTSSFSGRGGCSKENRDDESFTELDLEPSGCSRPRLSYLELFHSRNIWKNICVLGFTSRRDNMPLLVTPNPET
ncbi:unnamed protein product [Arctogadus glacialis]